MQVTCPMYTDKHGCETTAGFISCDVCGLKNTKSSDYDKAAKAIADNEDAIFLKEMGCS